MLHTMPQPRIPTKRAERSGQACRHRGRWIVGSAALLAVLISISYVAGYDMLYQILPWQHSTGMQNAIVAAAIASRPEDAPAPASPQLQHGTMIERALPSALMGGSRPYLIYLPPNYNPTGHIRYPVLYLLHGAPGKYTDWRDAAGIDQTLDALISVGRIQPLIVVLPDGNGGMWGDTEWANNGDGSIRAEDYVIQEVVPWIDGQYRTLADRQYRAIGGLSTGGFGAINIALHHPDLFGYALGLSGNYLAGNTWTGKNIWANDDARRFNSPILYAPSAPNVRSLQIYLTTARADSNAQTNTQTKQLDAVLRKLRVPHRTELFDGDHSWTFWKTHIVDGLDWLAGVLPHVGTA